MRYFVLTIAKAYVYIIAVAISPFVYATGQCTVSINGENSTIRKISENNSNSVIQNTKHYSILIEELYTGFNHPWGIAWYRTYSYQEDPIIISERNGGVWILVGSTIKQITQLPQDVCQQGQGGWFDIAQAKDGTLYLSYAKGIKSSNATAIISFHLNEDEIFNKESSTVVAQQVTLVYEMNKKVNSTLHFGGMLSMGLDSAGKEVVFLGLGERGQRYESQSLASDHGTIQLIDLHGGGSTIISYGHRNPQGLYYDFVRNKLYETEHGPKGGDEFNLINVDSTSLKNYGWPVVSYGKEYSTGRQVGEGTSKEGMEEPLYYWDISPALSGLSAYYGKQFEKWNANMFVTALKFQQIYRIILDSSGTKVQDVETLLNKSFGRIRSIKMYNDDIYFITDQRDGSIYRIRKNK